MAFSSSFFTIEPDAGKSADANNRSSNAEMSVDNGKPTADEEKEGLGQPPDSESHDNNSELQQLPMPSPSASHKSTHTHTATNRPRQHSELIPSSDPATQLLSDDKSSTMGNHSKSATKRKKGTATTVKTPKRARPGLAKKSKKPKRENLSPTASRNGVEKDGDSEGGDGSSDESDSGPYCLCRGPDNHRFMIACDRCEDWFHGDCIGMDKYTGEVLVQKYICPNCSDGKRYVTRYKKMCALEGCNLPARIYDPKKPSIFCSQEHCQSWWEQLVASLPKTKGSGSLDILTQDEFVGLLDSPPKTTRSSSSDRPWKLGDTPFGVSPTFWEKVDLATALTPEERAFLDQSTTERHSLGEDIVLHKKMLQLIEMALKQRDAAIIPAGTLTKDVCGYDSRLDTVGVTQPFSAFIQTPEGEAIFKAGRLEPASMMCTKKKCKTHQAWGAILTKTVKHSIKELAAQAKEKLDAEMRMRNNAAGRFRRKQLENNSVVVFDDLGDDDDDDKSGKDVEMG